MYVYIYIYIYIHIVCVYICIYIYIYIYYIYIYIEREIYLLSFNDLANAFAPSSPILLPGRPSSVRVRLTRRAFAIHSFIHSFMVRV